MNFFLKIYRSLWLVFIMLFIFLDRQNLYWVTVTILLLIILSSIAVFRSIESRNEWRRIIQEESINEEIP